MSCAHITAYQLACSPSASTAQDCRLRNARYTSTYLGRKLPVISLKSAPATPSYLQVAPVCVFGGKGKSEDGSGASPWKSLEKAMGNFKKDQSIEDVLRQQIQKQEYYDDGGSGGKGRDGGGGDGNGDGSGEGEVEGPSGMWDEFGQVIFGTIGFVFLYVLIIEGEEITVNTRDIFKFLFTGKKSIRLRRLMNQWKRWFKEMTEKEEYDPDWLETEILKTTTMYDSPVKYISIVKAYLRSSYD